MTIFSRPSCIFPMQRACPTPLYCYILKRGSYHLGYAAEYIALRSSARAPLRHGSAQIAFQTLSPNPRRYLQPNSFSTPFCFRERLSCAGSSHEHRIRPASANQPLPQILKSCRCQLRCWTSKAACSSSTVPDQSQCERADPSAYPCLPLSSIGVHTPPTPIHTSCIFNKPCCYSTSPLSLILLIYTLYPHF